MNATVLDLGASLAASGRDPAATARSRGPERFDDVLHDATSRDAASRSAPATPDETFDASESPPADRPTAAHPADADGAPRGRAAMGCVGGEERSDRDGALGEDTDADGDEPESGRAGGDGGRVAGHAHVHERGAGASVAPQHAAASSAHAGHGASDPAHAAHPALAAAATSASSAEEGATGSPGAPGTVRARAGHARGRRGVGAQLEGEPTDGSREPDASGASTGSASKARGARAAVAGTSPHADGAGIDARQAAGGGGRREAADGEPSGKASEPPGARRDEGPVHGTRMTARTGADDAAAVTSAPRFDLPAAATAPARGAAPSHGATATGAVAPTPAVPGRLAREETADGAVLRHAAHLRVAAPGIGELELHLRVRHGVAHVRLDGDGARRAESRLVELSTALAGEGLKLGHVEVKAPAGTDGSSRGGGSLGDGHRGGAQDQRDDQSHPSRHPQPTSHPTPAARRRAVEGPDAAPRTSGRFGVRA